MFQAERDSLNCSNRELERRLEKKDAEMHDKEDELFLQLEKAIRLEEDCEKVSRLLLWHQTNQFGTICHYLGKHYYLCVDDF